MVTGEAILIVTSSVELAQAPFAMVHLRVAEAPTTSPVTAELAEEGVVIVAVPETTDQVPTPEEGAFPSRVVLVTLQSA